MSVASNLVLRLVDSSDTKEALCLVLSLSMCLQHLVLYAFVIGLSLLRKLWFWYITFYCNFNLMNLTQHFFSLTIFSVRLNIGTLNLHPIGMAQRSVLRTWEGSDPSNEFRGENLTFINLITISDLCNINIGFSLPIRNS